jgi:hypothetical protein
MFEEWYYWIPRDAVQYATDITDIEEYLKYLTVSDKFCRWSGCGIY